MSVWSWIVLLFVVVAGAQMLRRLAGELISEAAFRWYDTHDEFAAEKPWYVLAWERSQARAARGDR